MMTAASPMTMAPRPMLISANPWYCVISPPARATSPLERARARIFIKSTLIPCAFAIFGLHPVARSAQPCSVPKYQYKIQIITNANITGDSSKISITKDKSDTHTVNIELTIEPAEDEEEFETPISAPENTDIETPEKESTEDGEELEKTVSESKKTDSDVTKIENKLNFDEKNDYKKSLAYLMGRRTGKIIRTAKSTLRKTSEQLNNYTKKVKSELEVKSQDVTVELNKVKANAKKKISGLAQEGKKQVGRTYTSTKETFEKMKAKAQDSEFRKIQNLLLAVWEDYITFI